MNLNFLKNFKNSGIKISSVSKRFGTRAREISAEVRSMRHIRIKSRSPIADCFCREVHIPNITGTAKNSDRIITNLSGTERYIINPTKVTITEGQIVKLDHPVAGDNVGVSFGSSAISEIIHFNPAETLKEAEKYTLDVLGIKSVDYSGRLDIANWTNEAFTNIFNKTKNRNLMPCSISVQPYEIIGDEVQKNTLALYNSGNIIVFSKALESCGVEGINKLLSYWSLDLSDKGSRNILHAFFPKEVIQKIDDILINYKSTGKTNLKSALIARDFEKEFDNTLTEFTNNHSEIFLKFLKGNLNLFNLTENNGKYIATLKENFGKTTEEVNEASRLFTELINKGLSDKPIRWEDNMALLRIMGDVFGKNNCLLSRIDNLEKMPMSFDAIFHETGHYAHNIYSPRKVYEIMRSSASYENYFAPYRAEINGKVSSRATADPEEFVAEMFKFKLRGVNIGDNKLDELYTFLGGPPLQVL